MLNQSAVCRESFLAEVARECSTFMPRHVIIVISRTSKAFTTCFAPIPEVTQVYLVVRLETILAAKCFIVPFTMVLSCVVIEHIKHLIFTFKSSDFPISI